MSTDATRGVRRRLLGWLSAGLVVMVGCSPSPPSSHNLVLICLDTVRFDTFDLPESQGIDDALSPAIRKASRFERARSPAPWTVPAVASLLTGLYPREHGAGHFSEAIANLGQVQPAALAATVRTLPERLQEAGYETAAFVAHPWFKAGYGLDRGFGRFEMRREAGKLAELATSWLDDRALAQPATDAPFALYLHFMEAHERHRASPEEVEATASSLPAPWLTAVLAAAPGSICSEPSEIACRRFVAYATTVLDLRRTVAGILEALEQRELMESTVVVLYSDHGEAFGDHGEEERALGLDPRGIYGIGHGQSLYQELLHVPLLTWDPGREGGPVASPASLVDVVATLPEWVTLELEPGERLASGVSLRRLAESSTGPARSLFASAIAYGPEQAAVFQGSTKFVSYPAPHGSAVFDLDSDPEERSARSSDEGEAALERSLAAYTRLQPPTGDEPVPVFSEEVLEELRALGYLDGGP